MKTLKEIFDNKLNELYKLRDEEENKKAIDKFETACKIQVLLDIKFELIKKSI